MDKIDIGHRIMKARQRKGYSTQQLSELIGKSQATVSRIENGKQGVGIELLQKLAEVLHIHPFSLLSDAPLRYSVLLPTGVEIRSDIPIRALSNCLHNARIRAHLTIAEAANHLNMREDELNAIELGFAQPEEKTLEKLSELFSLDFKELKDLATMDKQYPRLSQRMCVMERLLGGVLRLPAPPSDSHDSATTELRHEIETCLGINADVQGSAERNASYFSIGHLSDTLLKALQDPSFHEQVEKLAEEYKSPNDSENDLSDSGLIQSHESFAQGHKQS